MTNFDIEIHCPNPACDNASNLLSDDLCSSCQTQLVKRYLWAVGSDAALIPPKQQVADRYLTIAPQIWLDTQPQLLPDTFEEIPKTIGPYLRLNSQRLHIPEVYGVCHLEQSEILLLENAPLDSNGNLNPSIVEAWPNASAVRQIYWLWQLLELWQPLAELGVTSSLLVTNNLRVEGWRVRLRELYADNKYELSTEVKDAAAKISKTSMQPSLQHLGIAWATWFIEQAQEAILYPLQEICQLMQQENVEIDAIASSLNELLLQQVSNLHLRLRIASATDTGPQNYHNEDTCYPAPSELPADFSRSSDPLIPHLTMVCDGIGGHEGGEVASQLAVKSLKLQVQALVADITEDNEIRQPDLVADQLAAILRVANNLIASRNDEQGRELRRRMGTTVVMALQLPQRIKTESGEGNSHELYIANVGDSRAYWITPEYCHQLTIDDDVATREVKTGRNFYRQAIQRPDAGALTQALGTRDAEFLRPTVRRFILEEDGLLLLCSDGLSDNNWVEKSWANYAESVLKGQISLESAVKSLIELANEKNGHDNTSVVLSYCRISPEYPAVIERGEIGSTGSLVLQTPIISEASEAATMPEYVQATTSEAQEVEKEPKPKPQRKPWAVVVGVLILLISASAAGLFAWWLVNPAAVKQMRDRLLNPAEQLTPPQTPSP